MANSFLAGALWGTVCGVAVLGVASQTVERRTLSFPKPQASAVEVPGGSEFDQARPESDPVVPGDVPRPSGEEVAGFVPPADGLSETPPAFDTSSLQIPQPTTEGPSELGDVPDIQEDAEIDVSGPGASGSNSVALPDLPAPDAPGAAPETETDAPEAMSEPADEDAAPEVEAVASDDAPDLTDVVEAPAPSVEVAAQEVDVASAPTAPAVPEGTAPSLSAPETDSAPETVSPAPEAAPETEDPPLFVIVPRDDSGAESPVVPEPQAPSLAGVAESPRVSVMKPAGEIQDMASNVTTDRLPRIGDAEPDEDSDGTSALPSILPPPGTEDVAVAPTPPASAAPRGAFDANRVAFDGAGARPLVSVVLIQEGATPLPDADLAALPETVSIAVDAAQPGAADMARHYKSKGREVVLIPNLPAGARPQDVEVALRENFDRIPDAVAVMDASGSGFQSNRAAVAQIVDVVEASGHGLITFPRGLNTAHQRAEQAGIPAGLIFRDVDGDGQTGDQIRRAFDRAAFRARQDTPVILVGSTQAATLTAIREWSLGNRAASITLAPVSAALAGNDG